MFLYYLKNCIIILFIFLPFFCNGNGENDIQNLRLALKKNPDKLDYYYQLALAYKYANPDSSKYFGKAMLSKIKPTDHANLGKVNHIFANVAFLKSELDSAISYFKKAIYFASKVNDPLEQGVYLSSLGQVYGAQGDFKKSLLTYKDALALMLQEKDTSKSNKQLALLYSNLGDNYGQLGLYEDALSQLYLCMNMSKQNKDAMTVAITQNSIATIHYNSGNLYKAKQVFEQALASFSTLQYPLAEAAVLINIGEINFKQHFISDAESNAKAAMHKLQEAKTEYNLGNLLNLMGEIEKEKGNDNKAILHFEQAMVINKKAGNKAGYTQVQVGLGEAFSKINNNVKAIENYMAALQTFDTEKMLREKKECLQKIALHYIKVNNKDSATYYFKKYDVALDSFLNTEKQNSITAQEIKYETSIKEATIAQQQAQLKTKKQQNIFLTIGLFCLGFVAAGLAWLYRKIKNKNAIIQLQKHEILHNIENNLGQMIVIFEQQSRIPGNEKNALENQERMLTLSTLNKMLYDNEKKGEVNIQAYLTKLCEAKKISTGNAVQFKVDVSEIFLRINMAKDIGLIINELSMNAIKYAYTNIATPTFSIFLRQENTKMKLVIQDNGQGIAANQIVKEGSGFGKQYVQKLVENYGGTMVQKNENGARFEIELKN
jgi:two-component system, sensor histidine kinase PdtaS